MDRTNAVSRILIGSVVEFAGLMTIVFLSVRPEGRSIPIVVVGVFLFVAGAITTTLAALQIRNQRRP